MLTERVTPFVVVWVLRSIVLATEWAHLIGEMLIADSWWVNVNLFLFIFILYTINACKETMTEANHLIEVNKRNLPEEQQDDKVPPIVTPEDEQNN